MKKINTFLQVIILLTTVFHFHLGSSQDLVISTDESLCSQIIKVLPFHNGLVASNARSEILLISMDGKIINKTGGYGSGKESFGSLADICTFRNLTIYAVDLDRQRILNFDYNLNLVGSLTNNANWPENVQFTQPSALQLAQTGEWFLIDSADPRLINIDIHGNPQWAYSYPLGGEQKYWQDIRILTINTGQRLLYLYDHFYKTIFILDYWGNLVHRIPVKEDVSSIFFWKEKAYYLSRGRIYGLDEKAGEKTLNAKTMQFPGTAKFISTGNNPRQLLFLSAKILVLMNE